MAFVIGKIETVKRRVQFDLPADEGKRSEKADFMVTLKVRDAETIRQRNKEISDFTLQVQREVSRLTKDPTHEMDIPEGSFDEKYLHEDVMNLEGIRDGEGEDLPFSGELLDDVLQDRNARAALLKVWREVNLDETAAKRKN